MNKLFIALILIVVCACKEISFQEPQPKGKTSLKEIPKTLQGRYLPAEKSDESNKDTLVITRNGYYVTNDSTRGTLGDSLVLKKYKGYYFFNDNENPEWLLRVVKQLDNGDLDYMFMDPGEKPFNEFLLELNKEIRIDSIQVKNEMLYQIDPTPQQLVDLIDKGYFRKSARLKKIKL
jgi:hypothetical protein